MGYEWGDLNSHTSEDYNRMKDWGFNVVRLPISWNYIEPEPEVYDENYLTEMEKDDVKMRIVTYNKT